MQMGKEQVHTCKLVAPQGAQEEEDSASDDPLDSTVCEECGDGGDESHLMLCDGECRPHPWWAVETWCCVWHWTWGLVTAAHGQRTMA